MSGITSRLQRSEKGENFGADISCGLELPRVYLERLDYRCRKRLGASLVVTYG